MKRPFKLTAVASCRERSHDAEVRLLETSAKLQEVQLKQKELEARNLLLEKVARLSKQSVARNPNPKQPRDLPWEVGPLTCLRYFCPVLHVPAAAKHEQQQTFKHHLQDHI